MRYRLTAILAALSLFIIPSAAFPSVTATSEDSGVQDVERVEVTGSRLAWDINDVTTPAYVITKSDIDASGARDVSEVLERVPGVSGLAVGASMTQYKNVKVRGLTNEVLLLVDGVPFTNTQYTNIFSAFDLRQIPLSSVERIEVVKGASSAVYGSNAAGGVINVITRKSGDKNSASVKLEGGGNGWFRGTVRGTAVMSGDMRATLSYSRIQEAGDVKLAKLENGGYDYATDYRGNDYLLQVTKGKWSFTGEAGDNRSKSDYYNYPYAAVPAFNQHDWLKTKYQRFALNYKDETNVGRIYYNKQSKEYYNGFDTSTTNYDDYSVGATFNRRQDWGCVPVVWGLDWRLENAKYEQINGADTPYDLTRSGFAPYVEASVPVGDANFDLGLRYEYWNVDEGDDVNEIVPKVSLNWQSPSGKLWYATAGRFFAMPSFYQMFAPSRSYHMQPNPNLKPEKGWTYDIGVKDNVAKNPWRVGIFYMDMRDKVKINTGWTQYINVDEYRAFGVEGEVKFNLSDNWSYTQGLAWTKSEEKSGAAGSWQRTGDPRWDVSCAILWHIEQWSAGLFMHYYADRDLDRGNPIRTSPFDSNNIFIADASLAWKDKGHTLRLTCANIFDKEYILSYVDHRGYINPERRFVVSWEYEF